MFPSINKKETGVNLRRIMDMRGVNSTDMIEHLVAPYIYYKEWRF